MLATLDTKGLSATVADEVDVMVTRLVGDARPRRHGAGAVQELHQRIKRGIHPARQRAQHTALVRGVLDQRVQIVVLAVDLGRQADARAGRILRPQGGVVDRDAGFQRVDLGKAAAPRAVALRRKFDGARRQHDIRASP
ncbi:hypothetical protein G6F22_020585 [Rhizopus arrhizus]|nr:hypothetical protein G6F22_020585 [Rhizopus arrhizus]